MAELLLAEYAELLVAIGIVLLLAIWILYRRRNSGMRARFRLIICC